MASIYAVSAFVKMEEKKKNSEEMKSRLEVSRQAEQNPSALLKHER